MNPLPGQDRRAFLKGAGTITGAALIRPDGVIAWKPPAGTPTAEAAPQLTPILAALLST